MANPNKSPLKIWEKMERGRIQWLLIFGYPLLSQERLKLRTSNLAGTFTGPIPIKAHLKFRRKGSVGLSRDCPNFWVPPIISGTGKAMDFKFCRNIYRVDRNKSPWKMLGIESSSRGRSQGVPKIFRAPMYRTHCAVFFAIAQLSCKTCCN